VREVIQALLELVEGRRPGALATVVRASGSTPQKAGARLLLRADGTTVGTVGGGAIELAVVEVLGEVMRTGASQLVVRDLGHDLGMCCGGRMEVFVEAIEPAPRLLVMGAGHVARPTAALARAVGFHVVVVDDREELNTADRFPDCEIVLEEPPAYLRHAASEGRPLDVGDWVLIATHDHALDEETLASSMEQKPAYIGLVASRRKALRLVQRIAARRGPGVLERLDRVYAPVGLPIGGRTPHEIAVSIVAEVVALRHGADVAQMRAVGSALDDAAIVRLERGLTADRRPSPLRKAAR
jgi:xanthine dehydrogenase accessory factor